MNEDFDFLDLLSVEQLTENKLHLLLEKFRSAKAIKEAALDQLSIVAGHDLAQKIVSLEITDQMKKKHSVLNALNMKVLPYYAPGYPAWLKILTTFRRSCLSVVQ